MESYLMSKKNYLRTGVSKSDCCGGKIIAARKTGWVGYICNKCTGAVAYDGSVAEESAK